MDFDDHQITKISSKCDNAKFRYTIFHPQSFSNFVGLQEAMLYVAYIQISYVYIYIKRCIY